MKRFAPILVVALIGLASGSRLSATGYYGPDSYLDRGGANVVASPEFYWDLELKRIAREFPSPEKLRPASKESAGDAEVKDFTAALKEGRIKPPDAALALREQEEARTLLSATDDKSTAALPAEFASEFADYHRGAWAWRMGPQHGSRAECANALGAFLGG